jgi:adenine/guanine/hypoxanthine permease
MSFDFKLEQNKTTVKTEILAGVTTFLAMAYILAVNPNILSAAGMPRGGILVATAVASFVGTMLMALLANYPFALAPGMGLNAYFAFTVVLGMGYSWQFAMLAVFVEGLIFLLLSLTKVREAIFNAIPLQLKRAVGVGIGLFIAFIAMQNAKIIVDNPATLVSFQHFTADTVHTAGISTILALVGVLIIAYMMKKNIRGSILLGIFITWILGIICQATGIYVVDPAAGFFSLYPNVGNLGESFKETWQGFTQIFAGFFCPDTWTCKNSEMVGWDLIFKSFNFVVIMFAFLFVDLFDTLGTLIGVSSRANMLDKEGKLANIRGALCSDAIATSVGAVLGTSTTTTFVESATGVAEGGRTGLTAVTTAILFLVSIIFAPIFLAIPSFATAPALIIVGFYMMRPIIEINFDDFEDAIPAYITILAMPFAYSISEGICLGIISWTVINLAIGKAKRISPLMYILTILFLLKYILL